LFYSSLTPHAYDANLFHQYVFKLQLIRERLI